MGILGRLMRIIVGIVVLLHLFKIIGKIIPLIKELIEAKRVKNQFGVISVEAEIVDVTAEQLSQLDVQYNIRLRYEVGTLPYYKDIVMLNKQSARVGQCVTLLCDECDPSHATVQSGAEISSLKNLIFDICADFVILAVDIIWNVIV